MKARTKAVIDIETSGFSKTKNALCEVGILIIDSEFKIIDKLNILIKPYDAIYTQKAFEINRISIARLEKEGIESEKACEIISEFIEKYQVLSFIGHNVKRFDLPFLRAFFDRFSAVEHLVNFDAFEDTWRIASSKLRLDSYSLDSLCNFYHVKNKNAHTAVSDCEATLEVYKNLIS